MENGNVNPSYQNYHLNLTFNAGSILNARKADHASNYPGLASLSNSSMIVDIQEDENESIYPTVCSKVMLGDGQTGGYNKAVHNYVGHISNPYTDKMPYENELKENDFDSDTILSILCGPQSTHTNRLLPDCVQEAPSGYKSKLRSLLRVGKMLPASNHSLSKESVTTSNLIDEPAEADDPLAITPTSNNFDCLKVPVKIQEPEKRLVPVIRRLQDKFANAQRIFYSSFEQKKVENSANIPKRFAKPQPKNHLKRKRKRKPMVTSKQRKRSLMEELAVLTSCRSKVDSITLSKAENTIHCLKNRSAELETIHSKLLLLNQDLLRQKSLILSDLDSAGYHTATFARESSILPNASDFIREKTLTAGTNNPSEITSTTSGIDGFMHLLEETYDLNCDSQSPCRIIHTERTSCGQTFCQLGCVCESLNAGVPLLDHCQIPSCMFECTCSDSEDEKTSSSTYNSPAAQKIPPGSEAKLVFESLQSENIRPSPKSSSELAYVHFSNGKLSILKSGKCLSDSTGGTKLSSKKGKFFKANVISTTKETLSDEKLFQQCHVRLERLNLCCRPSTQKKIPNKLLLKAYIPLIKVEISPTHKVYCMDHCRYKCSCFQRKRKLN